MKDDDESSEYSDYLAVHSKDDSVDFDLVCRCWQCNKFRARFNSDRSNM